MRLRRGYLHPDLVTLITSHACIEPSFGGSAAKLVMCDHFSIPGYGPRSDTQHAISIGPSLALYGSDSSHRYFPLERRLPEPKYLSRTACCWLATKRKNEYVTSRCGVFIVVPFPRSCFSCLSPKESECHASFVHLRVASMLKPVYL